jgi:transposase
MGRRGKKELSEATRGRILALRDEGHSYRRIAKKICVSTTAVYTTVNRARKYGTTTSLPRSGRPRKISTRTRHIIIRMLRIFRFEPYKSIAKRIGTVTERQVRQVAASESYHRRVALRKPFLNRRMAIKRLEWARVNRFRNWEGTMWTDEVICKTGELSSRPRVTRKPGEADLPACIVPTFESGRQALMAWGCISQGYKGPLIRLKTAPYKLTTTGRWKGGGLTSQDYAEQVLSGPMKDSILHLEKQKGQEILVVEDGAPPHRGKAAREAREKYGIHQLPHPPNSPDLNPIEPIWRLLKKRIDNIPGSRANLETLWKATQAAWDSITVEEINRHTSKMNARVAAVAKAKGYQTKF